LGKRGVQVHFLERPVSQKPEDLLLVQMQGVIAEYERAKILERTRRGRLHKVKSGQMLPFNHPPYGYRVVRTPQVPQGEIAPVRGAGLHPVRGVRSIGARLRAGAV
jgi:site-specific DNA recombinase